MTPLTVIIIVVSIVGALIVFALCGICIACLRSHTKKGMVVRGPPAAESNVYTTGTSLVKTHYPAQTATPFVGMSERTNPPQIESRHPNLYPPTGMRIPHAVFRPPGSSRRLEDEYPKQQTHNPNYYER